MNMGGRKEGEKASKRIFVLDCHHLMSMLVLPSYKSRTWPASDQKFPFDRLLRRPKPLSEVSCTFVTAGTAANVPGRWLGGPQSGEMCSKRPWRNAQRICRHLLLPECSSHRSFLVCKGDRQWPRCSHCKCPRKSALTSLLGHLHAIQASERLFEGSNHHCECPYTRKCSQISGGRW
jgi:hypothetical protein